jgi:fumarate hydratase class II
MTANTGSVIDHLADECVDDMGDIFSNVDANRDTGDDDCDPRAIATAAVKRALRNLFERLESQNPLRMKRKEYEGIVS